MSRSQELLGPSGPLARSLPGYEVRPGQLEFAGAVERCLAEEHVLICEAGTGTGKTLAYLVPAVLSGRRVIVSTATRALQHQIFEFDLPLIRDALGIDVNAALMKGIGNYVCRRRYREHVNGEHMENLLGLQQLHRMREWMASTVTGDVAELTDIPETDPLLGEVVSSTETRIGRRCSHFEECFVTRMRAKAEQARIIVVNHHLFFADLALRGPHPGRVIPNYDAVIFDEAHQLEDVASFFLGTRLASAALSRLFAETERHLSSVLELDQRIHEARMTLFGQARERLDELRRSLERTVNGASGRVPLEPEAWVGALRDRWLAMDHSLERIELEVRAVLGGLSTESRLKGQLSADVLELDATRTHSFRTRLSELAEGRDHSVYWLELSGRSFVLSSSPMEMSRIFQKSIFQVVPSVVLTSATLATHSSSGEPGPSSDAVAPSQRTAFRFVRSRLGLDEMGAAVREMVVESPFDYASRALFYTPTDLPLPGSKTFLPAAAERIVELVEVADGGAFVLTTSFKAIAAFADTLRARCPERELLVQGDGPKPALLRRFREAGAAVLVATLGFWEGVDVPGHALRLVILDKIPFAVPTEPIVQARAREIERQGRNAFLELFLPAAAITLKQGFGRLIRTRSDYGTVALLDPRIELKPYGRQLARALPGARRTRSLADVRDHFERMRGR